MSFEPDNERRLCRTAKAFAGFWILCLVLGLTMTGLVIWGLVEAIQFLQRH